MVSLFVVAAIERIPIDFFACRLIIGNGGEDQSCHPYFDVDNFKWGPMGEKIFLGDSPSEKKLDIFRVGREEREGPSILSSRRAGSESITSTR